MSKAKKLKPRILERLAAHLARFYPELRGQFMCPTCLKTTPVTSPQKISEAHIIPRAADGKLRTFLCQRCNSDFGSKQDRWFGEYLNLVKSKKDPLEANTARHVEIEGIRYGATVKADRRTGIEVFVDRSRSSPAAIESLSSKRPTKFSVQLPILGQRDVVDVGFLTAAYLLWFHEFGYSWVLQHHLDPVREQIRNPTSRTIDEQYSVRSLGDCYFDKPWAGVCVHENELVLLAGLANRLVCLPACDKPFEPFGDLSKPEGKFSLRYRVFALYTQHRFEGPLALGVADRVLIAPDVFWKQRPGVAMVYFPAWDSMNPQVMPYFLSKEQADELSDRADAAIVESKGRPQIPIQETGRPVSQEEE